MQLSFTPYPVLTTERLLLRQFTPDDEPAIYAIRNNASVNLYLDRPTTHTHDDVRQFIAKINTNIANNQAMMWGIVYKTEPDQLLGSICFWNISETSQSAEIGYELNPTHQGKGIMHEAIQVVLQYGFETMQLRVIHAYTHHLNTASSKLLEKNNFKRNMALEQQHDQKDEVIYTLPNFLS